MTNYVTSGYITCKSDILSGEPIIKGKVNRAVVCIATVNIMGFDLINPSIETLAAKGIV